MKYFGYTKEQMDKVMQLLNTISVTGLQQVDAYHEATKILRHPVDIDVPEEVKEDGKEIHKD